MKIARVVSTRTGPTAPEISKTLVPFADIERLFPVKYTAVASSEELWIFTSVSGGPCKGADISIAEDVSGVSMVEGFVGPLFSPVTFGDSSWLVL